MYVLKFGEQNWKSMFQMWMHHGLQGDILSALPFIHLLDDANILQDFFGGRKTNKQEHLGSQLFLVSFFR